MPVIASMLIALAGLTTPISAGAVTGIPAPTPLAAPTLVGGPGAAVCLPGQRYGPPVDAPVTDPFRLPLTPFGPGNRGLEYRTRAGQAVAAIGAGVVTFAGSIGGSRYVTVTHPDGLRSSYSYLAEILVTEGQAVAAAETVGRTGERFHLGVRCGDAYIDPSALVGALRRWRARLVPDARFVAP